MTEEEILEMGVKPKKKTKSISREELDAMFAKRDEELDKKLEKMCDTCAHHECDCPDKIEQVNAMAESRMDQLDENDELLRQGINDLADKAAKDVRDLKLELEEERRLRVRAEEAFTGVRDEALALQNKVTEQTETIETIRKENTMFANQNLKLGILAGACLGLCLCVLAVFMAGIV